MGKWHQKDSRKKIGPHLYCVAHSAELLLVGVRGWNFDQTIQKDDQECKGCNRRKSAVLAFINHHHTRTSKPISAKQAWQGSSKAWTTVHTFWFHSSLLLWHPFPVFAIATAHPQTAFNHSDYTLTFSLPWNKISCTKPCDFHWGVKCWPNTNFNWSLCGDLGSWYESENFENKRYSQIFLQLYF